MIAKCNSVASRRRGGGGSGGTVRGTELMVAAIVTRVMEKDEVGYKDEGTVDFWASRHKAAVWDRAGLSHCC
jgi:hypothetical protein